MIKLDNLTKFYPLSNGDKHFVFREFTFTFPDDCSIGLIGRNGAGKSTLMRLLSGADIPNAGRVITDKKISWPVGLAGGFQHALSARDNVKFVARVYGYRGEALEEKVRYIEEFAEIGKYFDEPMNTYSSGMRSRIGFGLSMAFDFDYYLIDEAGAVGDAKFKQKSDAIYQEKLSNSKVIMVSHNMSEIEQWCDKVILVNCGMTTVYDDVKEGIEMYKRICS
ncbi:ABC transporter ATP-binding protein [Campylobacter hyointestinalis]|uniref:ABC transporter ATP-binding protein n=1 Tax=Campylobacter hyointestinalis subsp. lawsonii TaxID=91353 RepID=A0AAV6ED43_CAMHY|nr:ABC transporter ATP-binding protein [Campylobacter hyointestinalis]KAB0611559.1 ABC transporter ATP-binding protein [Campylobacter hyointestinalis subsp. lawsonii]QKF69729.1 capsular polysaccharide export system, ATP-binding cassette component [Campylobacter hyointestinalis subsp. lawsonii]RAZ22750.1 ABC transporter ATP-binding protein [Campylobacter hyointestinalis subsp. lawsonii]RAZ27387.1 ABC transporter ATP-binding protein [Campylobacter hyointestinalis subsp. lawsonii]RAZ38503.1 ABC t